MPFAPNVSVVSRGRVLANGTAASPIRVLPQVPNTPWGTFSVQGHGADSSIFSYVEFAQGGGALVDRIEYIGMVNVHRADGVVMDHNIFRDNLRSDDTFHGMHSRVYVRNSQFIRANSDALDLDIASGEITDNTFEASGGDRISAREQGHVVTEPTLAKRPRPDRVARIAIVVEPPPSA